MSVTKDSLEFTVSYLGILGGLTFALRGMYVMWKEERQRNHEISQAMINTMAGMKALLEEHLRNQ